LFIQVIESQTGDVTASIDGLGQIIGNVSHISAFVPENETGQLWVASNQSGHFAEGIRTDVQLHDRRHHPGELLEENNFEELWSDP